MLSAGDTLVDQVIALRRGGRGENICVLEIFQVDEIVGMGDQGDLEPEGRLPWRGGRRAPGTFV